MKPAAAGLMLGLGLALSFAGLLRALLYDIDARDPVTFAAATAVLGVASLAACVIPAVRAAHVDPATALRH
jgi:putative ABC transport system permease protein